MICKINDFVIFRADYLIVFDSLFYKLKSSILYDFYICHNIQKLIFVFHFFVNFMFFENETKVRLKFTKKNIFSI